MPWFVLLLVALPLAAGAFAAGRTDWQYQLAGLADPFLGRPAPGFTIILGVIASFLLAVGVWVGRALLRRTEPLAAGRMAPPRIRARWWFVLVVAWAAYGLGIASVAAAGGIRDYPGTMRLEFGPPVESTIEVPATCRTAVALPDVIAEVQPNVEGLYGLVLRNLPTGERRRSPEPTGVFVELIGGGNAATAYELPNVPVRPLPHIEMTLGTGETQSGPPIGFLGAYHYRVLDFEEAGMSGMVDVEGARFSDPFGDGTGPGSVRWVNLEIQNDPWPPAIAVRIEWTCRP
ncbi:MAG: hypothetical protein AB1736_05610 [Chloroflexota bacterium]